MSTKPSRPCTAFNQTLYSACGCADREAGPLAWAGLHQAQQLVQAANGDTSRLKPLKGLAFEDPETTGNQWYVYEKDAVLSAPEGERPPLVPPAGFGFKLGRTA